MSKTEKIKRPLARGVAKVPVVMQMEALECGAACLTMILAYYGRWVPLERLRADCGVSRDGSKAKNVLIAARSYGLTAKGYRYEPEELRKQGKFPCIIHWNYNHFVVLNGFRGSRAVLNDPARGTYSVSAEEFDHAFTGICLMFEPNEGFAAGGKPKSIMKFALGRLKGAGAQVAFAVITGVITALMGVISPVFSRIFFDRLLTGRNTGWLYPFLGALAAFSAVNIVVAWIKAVYSLKLDGKLAAVGSTSYFWHVLRLPMSFFSQRMAGDILGRQSSNASVAGALVNTLAPLVLDTGMMVFYFAVMLRYSPFLTLIGVVSIIADLLVSRCISEKRMNITRVAMRDSGLLAGATIAGIEMIESIKASGAENGFFEKWAGYQAGVNTQTVRTEKLERRLGLIPSFISTLCDTAVLMFGVYFAMNGSFTVGMIMAFQGFLSSFTGPALNLVGAGQTIQEMRTEMERIEDVMQYPEDAAFDGEDAEGAAGKLTGRIELRNVTFGYSRLEPPLIENFSMVVEPGQRVAFAGASGCGKSTLAKLISGLYQPWSGEVLFDGKPISAINRAVFTGSLAVVDQDVILFEDTIAQNIKMWDSSIEDFEMILAARDAQLHTDIMKREGGYGAMLTEGGKNLSGGQRQRLEIARVLAQDPTIVIMDEATSALDARTEYETVNAIRERGVTCVIIAHRLSTIRDCDEIIVMDHGKVAARGTHEQLYRADGLYKRLVSSD